MLFHSKTDKLQAGCWCSCVEVSLFLTLASRTRIGGRGLLQTADLDPAFPMKSVVPFRCHCNTAQKKSPMIVSHGAMWSVCNCPCPRYLRVTIEDPSRRTALRISLLNTSEQGFRCMPMGLPRALGCARPLSFLSRTYRRAQKCNIPAMRLSPTRVETTRLPLWPKRA